VSDSRSVWRRNVVVVYRYRGSYAGASGAAVGANAIRPQSFARRTTPTVLASGGA